VQEVVGKRPELVRGLDQPLQHRVRIDLEHPRGAADAQAFSKAADDMHDEIDRDALAMEQGAVGLQKVSITAGTVELAPGATSGMPVGAEVPQPQPAAIATGGIGTEVS
jgi:hypothetical protein